MTANIQEEVNQIVELKNRATRLDNLIQGYRLCARTEGKSEKTIRITTTALTILRDFLEGRQYPTDVTEIGACELREFILHLQQVRAFEHHPFIKPQDKGLSGHAINCYLRAIRAFWSWLVREEIIMPSPFSKVRIPKPPKKIIATFSDKQLAAMLKAINTATPAGFRDWTMILVLLDTGLRASELVGLTMNNVNLEDGIFIFESGLPHPVTSNLALEAICSGVGIITDRTDFAERYQDLVTVSQNQVLVVSPFESASAAEIITQWVRERAHHTGQLPCQLVSYQEYLFATEAVYADLLNAR